MRVKTKYIVILRRILRSNNEGIYFQLAILPMQIADADRVTIRVRIINLRDII